MNVVAIPVFPDRPVLPILWTEIKIFSEPDSLLGWMDGWLEERGLEDHQILTIVFNLLGHVIIHYMLDSWEIQTFRSNICGH